MQIEFKGLKMQDNNFLHVRRSATAMLFTGAVLCVGSFLLSGCAETTLVVNSAKRIGNSSQPSQSVVASEGVYKVGNPYKIQGKWYTPQEDLNYVEIGVASWYGPNFHGKNTAIGETFDMYSMTAAHRTLPLPSVVRVTNLANNRSVILRVNDRGPFARDRILDISKAGAQALNFIRQGTARVKVEILREESLALKERMLNGTSQSYAVAKVKTAQAKPVVTPIQTLPAQKKPLVVTKTSLPEPQPAVVSVVQPAVTSGSHYIQVGAFGSAENAARLRDRLASLGNVQIQNVTTSSGVLLHKVRIGPIMGQQKTDAILQEVHGIGFTDAHIIAPQS